MYIEMFCNNMHKLELAIYEVHDYMLWINNNYSWRITDNDIATIGVVANIGKQVMNERPTIYYFLK